MQQSTAAFYELVDDPSVFIKQDWKSYTEDDHEVWGLLYERRMNQLRQNGSKIFLKGADTIGLKKETVPDLAEVNRRLAPPTGWEAVPVSGYIPAKSFFQCLSLRKFPTTVTIRKRSQLDYLPEPDIFPTLARAAPRGSVSPILQPMTRRRAGERSGPLKARLFCPGEFG